MLLKFIWAALNTSSSIWYFTYNQSEKSLRLNNKTRDFSKNWNNNVIIIKLRLHYDQEDPQSW